MAVLKEWAGVSLTWGLGSAIGDSILVKRKMSGESEWSTIATLPPLRKSYIDETLTSNTAAYYQIVVVEDTHEYPGVETHYYPPSDYVWEFGDDAYVRILAQEYPTYTRVTPELYRVARHPRRHFYRLRRLNGGQVDWSGYFHTRGSSLEGGNWDWDPVDVFPWPEDVVLGEDYYEPFFPRDSSWDLGIDPIEEYSFDLSVCIFKPGGEIGYDVISIHEIEGQ